MTPEASRRSELPRHVLAALLALVAAGCAVVGAPEPSSGPVPPTAGATRAFRDQPEVADLLPFAVSAPFLELRDACVRGR